MCRGQDVAIERVNDTEREQFFLPGEHPMHDNTLLVRLRRNEIGYFAHCASLQDCHGLGDTPEEALDSFMSSLELYAQRLPETERQALLSCRVRPCERD